MGFWRGNWKNFTEPANPQNPSGFFPHGAAGVFKGAALVYLSYIGYDAVSTMAEEVRDPVKDIPVGVSGSVVVVTVLYCLMAASMTKLLPYDVVRFIHHLIFLSFLVPDILMLVTYKNFIAKNKRVEGFFFFLKNLMSNQSTFMADKNCSKH